MSVCGIAIPVGMAVLYGLGSGFLFGLLAGTALVVRRDRKVRALNHG